MRPTDDWLVWGLRGLLYSLEEPERDWRTIDQIWLETSLAAAGTDHERAMRDSGVLVSLRDADGLKAVLRRLLSLREECQ